MPRPSILQLPSPSLRSIVVLCLLVFAVQATACAQGDASDATESAATESPAEPVATGDAPPTLTSRGPSSAAPSSAADGPAADGPAIQAPGASFNLPSAWAQEAPSSSMRLAQASIPGDAGTGELTVFYFGPGGGGGVDANLDRWIGQMETTGEPTRDRFAVGPFQVTWISIVGTLKPSTMGMGPTEPQPGSRLLGAVVEGPQGPWFFKATGPAATLDAAQGDFLAMLRSVRSPA